MAPVSRRTRRLHVLAQALFFASGVVALLYQVIWQRLLGFVTGLDLYAVTLIVAIFMLGMGLGSFAAGPIADRWPARRLFLIFAAAECIVAAFALVSRPLYHDLLYGVASGLPGQPALIATLAASTLLVPTFCMGATLPVLSRAVSESVDAAADRITGLYGWNTLGAAVGAWGGSAILVRFLGYERSLWVGALVNLSCAAATLAFLRTPTAESDRAPAAAAAVWPGAPASEPARAWRTWVAVYCLSGFIALGLEVVWFRLLGVVLKSTAFTFPLLLGFYLAGVGGGSLIGRSIAHRCRRPLRWFLLAQASIPLYAGLSVAALLWGLRTQQPILAPVRDYLASYEPIDFAFNFFALAPSQLALYVLAPAALILPPTFLMGVSFALLQRGVQSDLGHLGRRVGTLQAANILGSTVGVCVVGLVLIDRLGTSGTLQLLTGCSAVYLVLASADWLTAAGRPLRWAAAAAGVALAASSAAALPRPAAFWSWLHGVPPLRSIHDEDGTGLAVLTSPDLFFRRHTDVYVNGLGQSTIPFNGVHSFLGLVPVLLHPAPRNVAIIGLGSGDTAYSAAGRPETEVVHCVEIIGGQIRTLRALYRRTGYQGVGGLLDDPRIRFVAGDGRRYVMQSSEQFDIVEADALRPTSAYAGNLYSREYFELLRRRITPGGFAVTWAPTPRIHETFSHVFPYVAEVPPMLIGSNQPIAFDPEAIRRRARQPQTVEHYRRAGIELEAHVDSMLQSFQQRSRPETVATEAMLNTDLFPRDELRAP